MPDFQFCAVWPSWWGHESWQRSKQGHTNDQNTPFWGQRLYTHFHAVFSNHKLFTPILLGVVGFIMKIRYGKMKSKSRDFRILLLYVSKNVFHQKKHILKNLYVTWILLMDEEFFFLVCTCWNLRKETKCVAVRAKNEYKERKKRFRRCAVHLLRKKLTLVRYAVIF